MLLCGSGHRAAAVVAAAVSTRSDRQCRTFYTGPVNAAAIAQASTTAAASGRSTRDTTTGLGVEVAVVAVYAVIGGAVVDGCATACVVVHLAL